VDGRGEVVAADGERLAVDRPGRERRVCAPQRHDRGGLRHAGVGEDAERADDHPREYDALQREASVLLLEQHGELVAAAVEMRDTDPDARERGGERKRRADPERSRQRRRPDTVGERKGHEHHGERADQRDRERRGAGEDRGHEEAGHEQEADREADQCEQPAPSREDHDEDRERDGEPQQRGAPVDVGEPVGLRAGCPGRGAGRLHTHRGARADPRDRSDRPERDARHATPGGSGAEANRDHAAPLSDRPRAADGAGRHHGGRERGAAERLRRAAGRTAARPEHDEPDHRQDEQRGRRTEQELARSRRAKLPKAAVRGRWRGAASPQTPCRRAMTVRAARVRPPGPRGVAFMSAFGPGPRVGVGRGGRPAAANAVLGSRTLLGGPHAPRIRPRRGDPCGARRFADGPNLHARRATSAPGAPRMDHGKDGQE
jgi:hypothetical protein